jgi:hypothetical protein
MSSNRRCRVTDEERAAESIARDEVSQRLAARLRPALDGLNNELSHLHTEVEITRRLLAKLGNGEPYVAQLGEPRLVSPAPSPQVQGAPASVPPPLNVVRRSVVLNCANIGFDYQRWLDRNPFDYQHRNPDAFSWEGVRKAVKFYCSKGIIPHCVCNNTIARITPVPSDLTSIVNVTPNNHRCQDADDIFTIRLAMKYGCQFVDNDNYMDWVFNEGKCCADQELRDWLLGAGEPLKLHYGWKSQFGLFVPSKKPPEEPCAELQSEGCIPH